MEEENEVYVTDVFVEEDKLIVKYSDETTKEIQLPYFQPSSTTMELSTLDEAPTPKEVIDKINEIIATKPLLEVNLR